MKILGKAERFGSPSGPWTHQMPDPSDARSPLEWGQNIEKLRDLEGDEIDDVIPG